jgi:hypothetical protein
MGSSTEYRAYGITKAEHDVLEERQNQRVENWDHKNVEAGLSLDQYIGVAMAYVGRATCASRNDPKLKRDMLMKAAAVILQAMDRIDEGVLSTATPAEFGAGSFH